MENKTQKELVDYCKTNGIRGYSGKNKDKLMKLIKSHEDATTNNTDTTSAAAAAAATNTTMLNTIVNGDAMQIMPTMESNSAQIIIADPPYNIGKDFGNDSDKQPLNAYLEWTDAWIKECLRILKPNGTMFIYGFS